MKEQTTECKQEKIDLRETSYINGSALNLRPHNFVDQT